MTDNEKRAAREQHDSIEERFRQLDEWEYLERVHNGPSMSLYPDPPAREVEPPWWAEHYDEDPNQQENK